MGDTLTLIVSLEAIFLSTFVMIGQNRQAEFSRKKAAHDYEAQELELRHNTELTRLIHALTVEIHQAVTTAGDDADHAHAPRTGDRDGGCHICPRCPV
ncbi:DUF1003 domain-containing protein [Streptomyces sp. NPDC048581]|uniref:DUF1003 domain-containing protein n=1 Tax=unclassified Streptomyces TaxID=2593676 RepID=UPI003717389F